jgi:hypothetical protein
MRRLNKLPFGAPDPMGSRSGARIGALRSIWRVD